MKKYYEMPRDMALFIAVPDAGKEAAFRAAEPRAEPCLGLWEGMAEVAYVMDREEFRRLETLGFFNEQMAVVVLAAVNGGSRRGWVISDRMEPDAVGLRRFWGAHYGRRTMGLGKRWEAFADIPFGPGYTFIPSTGLFYALS